MLFEVLGKQRFQGTSKRTGKPYDFTRLHCVCGQPLTGCIGQAVEFVDCGRDVDVDAVGVGSHVQVYYNKNGYVDTVEVVD